MTNSNSGFPFEVPSAESIASSLIREHLHRRRFLDAYDRFEIECAREETSINKRHTLAKVLHLENEYQKVIGGNIHVQTIIELMTLYFIDRHTKRTKQDKRKKGRPNEYYIHVKQVALSVCREFLHKKSYNQTLLELDNISPRSGGRSAISNRLELVHILHIGKLIGKYGFDDCPILEVMVKGFMSSTPKHEDAANLHDKLTPISLHATDVKSEVTLISAESKHNGVIAQNRDFEVAQTPYGKSENVLNTFITPGDFKKKFIHKENHEAENNRQIRSKKYFSSSDNSSSSDKDDMLQSTRAAADRMAQQNAPKHMASDLVFEDVEDFGDTAITSKPDVPQIVQPAAAFSAPEPITLKLATELKILIFGTANKSFSVEWKDQSFTFGNLDDLKYGVVQKKGGPCGLLAAVQAFIVRDLIFKTSPPVNDIHNPPNNIRTKCLVSAISKILWRAGFQRRACVVKPVMKPHFIGGGRYQSDQLTESLTLYSFNTYENLQLFVEQNINQFEVDGRSGCVLFLYSLILSHGIDQVQSDMDVPTTSLIAAHGYCTQEMVNLIVNGKATSNAFNNKVTLGDGKEQILLRGVEQQCEVGLLSLFEHYKSCEVGSFYKCPKYPLWIICSESHFSVLFSESDSISDDSQSFSTFNLIYYDGLAKQDEKICLTIDISGRRKPVYAPNQLVPPLEHCIRTKWQDAVIDWNGSEPIL